MYLFTINKLYFIFWLFIFFDFISCLRLDYFLNTHLTNEDIFSPKNMDLFFKTKKEQKVLVDSKDFYKVKYPGKILGYHYTNLFTIKKEPKQVEIFCKNEYIENRVIFLELENIKGISIQVESVSSLKIPNFLHKRIIKERMKTIINKITEMSSE